MAGNRGLLKRHEDRMVLSVDGLRLERDGTRILDGIFWRVTHGQHWAMLGANGSGKTSLLSALTGYLMPTAGEICLLGETYGRSDWRELRKKIGIVSSSVRQMMADEEMAQDAVASGKYAMIQFWGRVSRSEKAEALQRLRQVECEYLARREWRVLSQGERQRVLIGRALMARPQVLILDEPCAGLDPAARRLFRQPRCAGRLRPAGRGANYVIERSRTVARLIHVAAIRSTGLTACLGIAEHVTGMLAQDGAITPGPPQPLRAAASQQPQQQPQPQWWRRAASHHHAQAAGR